MRHAAVETRRLLLTAGEDLLGSTDVAGRAEHGEAVGFEGDAQATPADGEDVSGDRVDERPGARA